MPEESKIMQLSLVGVEPKEDKLIRMAERCLELLNEKSGQKFNAKNPKGIPTAAASIIIDRLNEGYTEQQIKQVFARMCREWSGTELQRNLAPTTLCRRSNFEKYLAKCV